MLPKDTVHRAIHEYLGDIPAPKEITAEYALEQLKMLMRHGHISETDPPEKRLRLLAAIFDYSDQPTADAFRKQIEIIHKFTKKPP